MSSSTTGLARSRPLRKPVTRGDELGKEDVVSTTIPNGNETGNNAAPSPSRLPQIKPLTRSGSVNTAKAKSATTAATAQSTRGANGSSLRPMASLQSSTRRPSPINTSSTTTKPTSSTTTLPRSNSVRPVSMTSSQMSSAPTRSSSIRERPPSSSSTARTTRVTTRPTSSASIRSTSSTTQRTATLGHARSKSSATALTAATTLRPRSIHAPSGSTTPTTTTHSKPVTRSQTTHARNASSSQINVSSSTQAPNPIAARPAFNMNQQHYSPLKNFAPKPLTSQILAPPSPSKLPANVALSAETSRLQTELLQLSLLHRSAASVSAEWHESAKQKMGARFGKLVKENDELRLAERDGFESRNAAALLRWGSEQAGQHEHMGLDEKIQVLDQVLNGVWSMSEPEGRYSRVVADFEDWADKMAEVVSAQRSGDVDALINNGGGEVLFASELEKLWKGECAGLQRKLDGWRGMLRELGDADDTQEDSDKTTAKQQPMAMGQQSQRSSLARVLDGCRSLVNDMLSELAAMQDIERESIRAENEWIEKMNDELRLDDTPVNDVQLWKLVV